MPLIHRQCVLTLPMTKWLSLNSQKFTIDSLLYVPSLQCSDGKIKWTASLHLWEFLFIHFTAESQVIRAHGEMEFNEFRRTKAHAFRFIRRKNPDVRSCRKCFDLLWHQKCAFIATKYLEASVSLPPA